MRFQFVSPTTSHSPLRSGNTHSLSLGHQRQITRQKGVTIASVMIDCTTRMAQVTLGVIPRPPKAGAEGVAQQVAALAQKIEQDARQRAEWTAQAGVGEIGRAHV